MSNTDFFDFGEDNEVLEPSPEEGIVQWHSARDCEAVNTETGEVEDSTTAGWHVQIGKYPYLDKVCEKAKCRKVYIDQNSGKNGYWQIGKNGGANFFILAKGCYSESEMYDKVKRAGIAFGWHKGEDGKSIKTLKFRAFIKELLPFFDEENPAKPVIVVAKKGFVNDLLPILGRDGHHRVIKANDQGFLEKRGKATKTPYWGISLFLGPGKKIKRMNKDKSAGSTVSPIITDIPATITPEFLASHHVGYFLDLVREEIMDSNYSIEWSLKTSQEIEAGANGNDEESETSFDISDLSQEEMYEGGLDDDTEQLKQGKPASRLTDDQLARIAGTALLVQRKMLRDKFHRNDLAAQAGLSREDAVGLIVSLQKR
jgi:hypothetical protein